MKPSEILMAFLFALLKIKLWLKPMEDILYKKRAKAHFLLFNLMINVYTSLQNLAVSVYFNIQLIQQSVYF